MCVICVQGLAYAQEEQQKPSTCVEEREKLGRNVQIYESNIQTRQQDIIRYDAAIVDQRSALQGESCPKGNKVMKPTETAEQLQVTPIDAALSILDCVFPNAYARRTLNCIDKSVVHVVVLPWS